jgi:hypothetical protein
VLQEVSSVCVISGVEHICSGDGVPSRQPAIEFVHWASFWIDVVFLGRLNQWPGTDDDSELQMRRGLQQPLAELLDEYAKQAANTDNVIAARDWDAEAVGRDENTGKPFALGYIITHLIAETARHNGHLDILRELADGVTGD